MALAAVPFVPNDGSIIIADGAALTYTVPYEDGDFKTGPSQQGNKDVEHFFSRGAYYGSRKTVDKIVPFSFTAHAVGLTDAAAATLRDVIMGTGTWSAATNTMPAAAGDAPTRKITWTGERTTLGGTADAVLIYKYCNMTIEFAEGTPGKFTISGVRLPYSTDYETVT